MNAIDETYQSTIRAAIREAAADVAFSSGKVDDGAAVYRHEYRIAEKVVERMAAHYSHTRKAKTQRRVNA